MKLLVVSSLLPSSVEPWRAPFNWSQIRALACRCELRAVAPVPWAPPFTQRSKWQRFRAVPLHETIDGIAVQHPRYLVVPGRARGIQGWSYARCLEGILRAFGSRFRPAAVLATWAYPDVYAATRVARRHGLPVVAKVHGSDLNVLPTLGLGGKIRSALATADRVVAVGEDLRRQAVRLGAHPNRTLVVRNGLDSALFQPRDRQEARAHLALPLEGELILFVGGLHPVKGPDLLIESFSAIAARLPSARLALVGDGPLMDSLRARTSALAVAGRCVFAGRRPQAEVAWWLNAANVLVVPSRAEGVPNVVLEALASGTPVVAHRTGGIPEVLTGGVGGLLVEPGETADLAAAALAVLNGRFDSADVRASLQVDSWAASAANLLRVIEDAVIKH